MNYCPKCGFEVRNMKFCPKCGFELKSNSHQGGSQSSDGFIAMNSHNSEITTEKHEETATLGVDYRAELIGDNADHYLPIFDGMNEKNHASWNWCAFLFGPIWFAYRQLYGWAVIVFFSQLALGGIFGLVTFNGSGLICRIAGLIMAAIFAQRANYELKKRIDRLILEMPTDENDRRVFIKKTKGTSAIGLIVALAVVVLFCIMSVMLTTMAGASRY